MLCFAGGKKEEKMEAVSIVSIDHTDNIFKILFKDIDISDWFFQFDYWESYGEHTCVDFNEIEEIDSEFAKNELIYKDTIVYPEFIELFICKNGDKYEEIHTYKDFKNSNYFLSIILIDHNVIEIYCKDEKLLEQIKLNCIESSLKIKLYTEINNICDEAKMYSNRSVNDKSIYKESQMYTYYLDEKKRAYKKI